MGCCSLLQGIFLTQGLNPGLSHCRQILYCLSHFNGFPFPSKSEVKSWREGKIKRIRTYQSKHSQASFLGTHTTVLWPPHAKSWLIGKSSDAGRDWEQEEKGMTEDEMAGWHHWLNGCESESTPGVGGGQGGLACCDSWCCKELDTTERLNWTELNRIWVVVLSFSFISMHILISFLISSVICWLFNSVLFSLHMLEFLIVFLL